MPAKLPFFAASESLQQRWEEASSSKRIQAQVYVFTILITLGFLHRYVFAPASRKRIMEASKPYTYGSVSAPSSPGSKDETVGVVDSIYIYPIKSCAGVSVSASEITTQGFDLDRRWMIVRPSKAEPSKLEKLSLREEPRLTLIQPAIDDSNNLLRLKISDRAKDQSVIKKLGEATTTLRPSAEQLQAWRHLPKVEMYGDFADGRVAQSADHPNNTGAKKEQLSPSEWISEFLGYEVLLIHFDVTSSTARDAFPIFKPPTDVSTWVDTDKQELERKRGIEFQDEYPLLVATKESLLEVQGQLDDALKGASGEGDGRGGRQIQGLDQNLWSSNALSMLRFRPNIVIRSASKTEPFGPFSEDSWERLWILNPEQARHEDSRTAARAMLQLVARCQRCLLTAVDPVTAGKDPAVPLKLLNRSRMRIKKPENIKGGNGRAGPCFGMYAVPLPFAAGEDAQDSTVTYGSIKVDDAVRVRWRPFSSDDEPRGKQHL